MRKLRLLSVTLLLSSGMLFGAAPGAGATTCMIDDSEVEAVVCAVYSTAGGVICKPLEKWGCFQ